MAALAGAYQFSELFSVLFMRMNSYDPITALYYATGCITAANSNFIKSFALSVHLCKHDVTIFNITTHGALTREQFLR